MCATERGRRGARIRRSALMLVLVAVLSGAALAQQAPSREQEQVRRLRQQLQQLQQELAAARQAEGTARAQAARQLDEVQAEAARARRGSRAQAERIAALEAELAAERSSAGTAAAALSRREEELVAARQSLATVRGELAQRTEAQREGERRIAELTASWRDESAALALCTRNNQALRTVSLELLERWQRHDWRDLLAAREPFVQQYRVRIENLVQDYEDRIDRAWLAPAPAPVPAQGR